MNQKNQLRQMTIQLLEVQMLNRLKPIIGGIASLFGVFAFSYFYFYAKEYGVKLENLYWLAVCFNFSVFSGLLFAENRNKGVGSLYLMSFGFFGLCFIFSFADFLFTDELSMNRVYWALIISATLTFITYSYKWIKHYLS